MTLSRRVPRQLLLLLSLSLLSGMAFAADGEGLQLNTAPRWQARLQLSSLDANTSDAQRYSNGSRLLSANLLGDYYLTSSGLGGIRGGLRATGGMLLGPMSLSQASAGLACREGSQWRLRQLEPLPPAGTASDAYRTAASGLPPALLQGIDALREGDALDAQGERQARARGWQR